ncbi:MAG: phosphatidylserine/phosphatidylglycerophosphate/cardiolipin synthase family protein [Proteobacteria bacterium]|nr:MAG: phosphatidylserine/phosphatidylglycerophosphate/cardiolipin synthase family protein [Pseudomonadota bacterium]
MKPIALILSLLFQSILWSPSSFAQQGTLMEADRHAAQARLDLVMGDNYHEIKISTFILGDDKASRLYLATLATALERGKRVRLVVDPYQSVFPWAYLQQLVGLGLEVKVYNDYTPWSWLNPFTAFNKMNKRMHDKLFILDDSVLITGGRNVNQDYFLTLRGRNAKDGYFPFRDKDVWVEGQAAADASEYFEKLWADKNSTELRWPAISEDDASIARQELRAYTEMVQKVAGSKVIPRPEMARDAEFISNENRKTNVATKLIEEINNAKSEILIENPYVLLTKPMRKALEDAVKRNVRVVIFTNAADRGDEGLVGKAFGEDAPGLIAAGMEIYQLANRNTLHSKTMVIDRKVSFVGSFNLDNRSSNINRESGVLVRDEKFGQRMVEAAEKTKSLSMLMRYRGVAQKIRCDSLFGPGLAPVNEIQKLNLSDKMKVKIGRPLL